MRAVRDHRKNRTQVPAVVVNTVSWWTGELVTEGSDGKESEDEWSASASGLSDSSEDSEVGPVDGLARSDDWGKEVEVFGVIDSGSSVGVIGRPDGVRTMV